MSGSLPCSERVVGAAVVDGQPRRDRLVDVEGGANRLVSIRLLPFLGAVRGAEVPGYSHQPYFDDRRADFIDRFDGDTGEGSTTILRQAEMPDRGGRWGS